MAQTEVKNYNKPLTPEEEKRVFKIGLILVASAFTFMGIMSLLVHYDAVKLYPSSVNVDIIRNYAGRLEFTLRYQTLLVFWLMINILSTIYKRISTMSINPLYEKSEQTVQAQKNILTNSYEQIVLSVFAQLIYISFASPECVLKTIPLVNIIQFIGRITFFFGYPFKRAFGFLCTSIPTAVLICYNMYKFLSFLGLY